MEFKYLKVRRLSLAFLLMAFALFVSDTGCFAAKDNDSLQSEIDAINLQLQYLKIKVKDNKKKTRNIEQKIKSKKQEIQNLGAQIGQLGENRNDILAQIKKLEEENRESKEQLRELLARFRNRLVQLHKIRQGALVSSVLFAKDINSFLNRYQMVKYLLESDSKIIEELKEKDERVRITSEKLIEKNKALEFGENEIVAKQKQLAKEQATLNAMLNTVLMEKKVYLQKEKNLASSLKQLENEVAEVTKTVTKPSFAKEIGSSADFEPAVPNIVLEKSERKSEGSFEKSSDAAKIMNFSWPIEKSLREVVTEKGGEDSCAILIKPVADAEVTAAAKGKVLYKGFLSGLGDVVILGHQRGFSTVYARLDNVWVGLNEIVDQGTVIGKIDGGGSNCLLHFEIRFGGKKMPPLEYLPK